MDKKRTKYIIEVEKEVNDWDGWPVYRVVTSTKGPSDYLSADVVDSLKPYNDQNRNTESRIRTLTDELHKAQMEINRLVLENQEQDFEIHKLKKQRDEMFGRLVISGFRKCEYDGSEFLKDYIDKDAEELHETATTIIFGSPEERKDASERAAMNAVMIHRALEEAQKKLEAEGLTSVEDIREGILKMLGIR